MTRETATHEMRVLAAQQALDTLRLLGRSNLIDWLTIEWSNRFTSRLGDALYSPIMYNSGKLPTQARVRFSAPLWPRCSEEERRDTVIHEICHIVHSYETYGQKNYFRKNRDVHGNGWKSLMYKCGVSPTRCHSVDTSGLKRKSRKTVAMYCGCSTPHMVTPNKAKKITTLRRVYRCTTCKEVLQETPLLTTQDRKDIKQSLFSAY